MRDSMSEEKKDKWLSYVSVSTILFAVCATLSTFKGGQYSTKTVLNQLNVANSWAYYQSKDLKSYLHEIQKDQLELAVRYSSLPKEAAEEYTNKIAAYDEKIKKYDVQKKDIERDAKAYESDIKLTQGYSQNFGMAVIFLQIAILLASISALMKKISLWYGSLSVGSIGITYFCNGFFSFF
jgi:hypothetical protein